MRFGQTINLWCGTTSGIKFDSFGVSVSIKIPFFKRFGYY